MICYSQTQHEPGVEEEPLSGILILAYITNFKSLYVLLLKTPHPIRTDYLPKNNQSGLIERLQSAGVRLDYELEKLF